MDGANIEVVQLFSVFHDSYRTNEGIDDGHGERGGDLALGNCRLCWSIPRYNFMKSPGKVA